MGCDASSSANLLQGVEFQSTHPRGVRRRDNLGKHPVACFNPRTRVGCDGHADAALLDGRVVSIHAPAWGATASHGSTLYRLTWFQSTHPRGVRPAPSARFFVPGTGFNPRTRVGCDQTQMYGLRPVIGFQSTHPRGVRQVTTSAGLLSVPGFNPRTRVGCDAKSGEAQYLVYQGFNPRTRVGCDGLQPLLQVIGALVSIHAPAWGATSKAGYGAGTGKVSIHAPAWGATLLSQYPVQHLASFNPRTRVGCDCFHVLSSRFP